MKPQQIIAVVKDAVLFVGGLTGIAYQQITGNVHELLLLVFTAMVGLPGLSALLSMKHDGSTSTESSSRQSRPSQPPSDSHSS